MTGPLAKIFNRSIESEWFWRILNVVAIFKKKTTWATIVSENLTFIQGFRTFFEENNLEMRLNVNRIM